MLALNLSSPGNLLPLWGGIAWFGGMVLPPLALLFVAAIRRAGKSRVATKQVALPPTSIPHDLARYGQPWIGRLGFLGYQVVQTLRPENDESPERVTWLLASPADRSIARLTGTLPRAGGRPDFSLRLATFLADGRVITTADHPVTHRPPAHWSLCQQRFPTLEGQVQAHRSHVENRAGNIAAVLPAAGQLPARLAAEEEAVDKALVEAGDYRARGENAIRPVRSRVLAMACRDLAHFVSGLRASSGTKKDIASASKSATPGEDEIAPIDGAFALSPEQMVEQDIGRYRKHADEPAGMKHAFLRLALVAATVVAFTAMFGRDNIPLTVGLLLGIIAVHEFGHWIAMKAFGYRRMGRFFVPFIGPIDLGRKLHAPAWQQLLVIFAGPLPGLFAGMGVLFAGFFVRDLPLWLLDLGGLAVVLNAFYLLPFLPLDGGKVVDLLIFRDLPLLRPLFTGVSAIVTLLASLALKSRPLRFVAVGMFVGLVWDIKMIKVVRGGRRLAWAGAIEDEDEALQKIFRGVREEENEAFLRSHDWQRQIDVLLGEVLRKKPRFITRLFGGACYSSAWMPVLLLAGGIFGMTFVGNVGQLNRMAKELQEFQEAFPQEQRSLDGLQYAKLTEIVSATQELAADSASRADLAATAEPELGAALDRLDWTAAGIAHHCGEVATPEISLWLEILCGKLESATAAGSHGEALRRSEVMLFAVAAMEPALTLADRELLWDAQLRTLAAVEKLAASGKLDAATIQRLEARVNALNKAPQPEVENLLLVGGWSKRQADRYFAMEHDGPAAIDVRFWRQATPDTYAFLDTIKSFQNSLPTCVALARTWKKSRKVGELPATLEEPAIAAPGEAEFIAKFCESHRELQWRRLTTLSALRLEGYRLKAGKLPEQWQHTLPGGASLALVSADGPCLKLVDQRNAAQRALPSWLGSGACAPKAEHVCPLFGGPPELSRN